jgi:hypothetical protein
MRMNADAALFARETEAETLAELGAVFRAVDLPGIEMRVPRGLAERAVQAWERDDVDELGPETAEEREIRHRAGMLALIGLTITERGRVEGDEVVVTLPVEFIGAAIVVA